MAKKNIVETTPESPEVPSTLGYKLELKCKNAKQKEFLKSLNVKKKEICFGEGAAGSGKSFLSLAWALKQLKDKAFKKIVLVIPTAQAVEADMTMGYLKGELEDKVAPFLKADEETITKILTLSGNGNAKKYAKALIKEGYIQYEFVNFLLGKTLDDAIILVNEAEQYTKANMRLILTRLGENSKIIITGDPKQTTRKSIKNNQEANGLTDTIERLQDLDEVSITIFGEEDIVRNKLISKILERLD